MRTITTFCLSAILAAAAALAVTPPPAKKIAPGDPGGKPANKIQLAILLDTSSSMDGLIDQAKSQLWNIVNQLSRMKRQGVSPDLEVALYEYGNDGIPRGEGHIRCLSVLTTDLDKISEQLFALTTNGGNEFCGQVIGTAVDSLPWSAGKDSLRLIYIAGNEPFTQGKVDFHASCQAAKAKGIVVSTIFCGSAAEGIQGRWQEGAAVGGGRYMSIDQNAKVKQITAPQDAEIVRLGTEINATYVAYGRTGEEGKMRQEAQDKNAVGSGAASNTQRAMAKASTAYQNAAWDLVDADQKKQVDVSLMKEEELPEAMRKMAPAEREQYLQAMRAKRSEIQAKIRTLQAERDKYVAEQKKAAAADQTLDEAILKSTREVAAERGYQ